MAGATWLLRGALALSTLPCLSASHIDCPSRPVWVAWLLSEVLAQRTMGCCWTQPHSRSPQDTAAESSPAQEGGGLTRRMPGTGTVGSATTESPVQAAKTATGIDTVNTRTGTGWLPLKAGSPGRREAAAGITPGGMTHTPGTGTGNQLVPTDLPSPTGTTGTGLTENRIPPGRTE